MSNYPGKYIVFEGGDGCGKTTQIKYLEEYLVEKGYSPLIVREPGGTLLGEQLRAILKNPTLDKFLDPLTEFLFFSAARSALYKTEVTPALEQGRIVISDRNDLSSTIYQGVVQGVPLDLIYKISKHILDKNGVPYNPDCGILINPKINKELVRKLTEDEDSKKEDRFHHKGVDYHLGVYQAYEEEALKRGFHVVPYIEGPEGIKQMQQEIRRHVDLALKE